MQQWQKRLGLWLLASPILLLVGIVKFIRHLRLLRLTVQPSVRCRTCGSAISLLGFWRCGCGFAYQGHLLRHCPQCSTLPRIIRCYRCGVTQLLRGR